MCSIQRAELGYLLSGSELDSDGPLKNAADRSSVRSLSERHPAVPFDSLIRGNQSLGALLERRGFSAVPSPANRGPGADNPYFNGGYLTRQYGSRQGGQIDAIQVESARSFRLSPTRGRYAKAVACALHEFVCTYYSVETLPTPGCSEEYYSLCSGLPCSRLQSSAILLCAAIFVTSLMSNVCLFTAHRLN